MPTATIWISDAERSTNFDWDRSFSEPDLSDPLKHLNRFTIKHPHEYISVDDLKFFRRKKPPDLHTRSNICLYNRDEPVLPFGSLKSEYKKQFRLFDLSLRPRLLLRRATSLRLEGLMHHISEHQEQYHWYKPEDCLSCRTYPIKNPETFRLGDDSKMDPEYRSSYISYPLVDRTTKILPREMFRIEPDPVASSGTTNHAKNLERSPEEIAAINKLADDKFKRDVAAQEQSKCHLQQRAHEAVSNNYNNATPSEYTRQYIQYPIEKAHSIPQISHFKMQGDFVGVPEYQDSFKMYANYSKSAPIKKVDNLRISGAEVQASPTIASTTEPEYREKFRDTSNKGGSREKSLKTDDHLHPRGAFSKDVPEYYESFRDPQVKQMPERGKCREPYLRLKGKIEFNPEYRKYCDFPRSRTIARKPASSFRLPTTSTTTTTTADHKSPKRSPRRKYKSSSPKRYEYEMEPTTDLTTTPEYRRANYNYQLRERTPTRKVPESDGGGGVVIGGAKLHSTTRKYSDSSIEPAGKPTGANKRRPSRRPQASMIDPQVMQNSFENVGTGSMLAKKKPTKYGRRASVLQNAANCRENASIIEGNPKYTLTNRKEKFDSENRDSFVVLDEPCKRSNWMKKSWYES